MAWCAAFWAGLGGLLLETVLVRRHALLLGGTAEAAAAVLALFLLGLGIGGLWALQLAHGAGRGTALRRAAALYGAVAVLALPAERLLAACGPQPWAVGLLLAALAPGGLAVLMGTAFPLLFAGVRSAAGAGGMVGANLAGSVVAAWAGGNLSIPLLGLLPSAALGGGSYLLAALGAAWAARGGGAAAPPGTALAKPARHPVPGAVAAFGSGVLVLGLELLLLRRLPFWLEGFLPTLAGVLATCLLALGLGAALLVPPLARLGGRRAAAAALAVAGAVAALGLHELLTPGLARMPVDGDVGLHLRVLAGTAAGALLPFALLGAVVPLGVAAAAPDPGGGRARAAAWLFFCQGLGALVGALGVGHLLPRLAPESFFALAPAALGAVGLLLAGAARPRAPGWLLGVGLVAVGLGAWAPWSAVGPLWAPGPPFAGARYDHPEWYCHLVHRTDAYVTASVVYDRRHHSMLLFTDGFRAAETGPGTDYMKALGHLPMLLRRDLRDVAVVALGTGTTATAVTAWPEPRRIDVVEISPAVLDLVGYFGGDGPVMAGGAARDFLADPRTRVQVTDGRRYLARLPPGSLDLLTLEPLLPYAPGTAALYSAEFYALARRAVRERGLVVQWVPTHAMPRRFYDTLLATFARGFEHSSAWLVDQSTLLVGSPRPHLPDAGALAERYAELAPELRAALHETGLAVPEDVAAAFVSDRILAACGQAPSLRDARPFLEAIGYWSGPVRLGFYPGNVARLVELARAAAAPLGDARQRVLRLRGLAARARVPLELARGRPAEARGAARDGAAYAAGARASLPDSVLLHAEETRALRARAELAVQLGGDARALAAQHLVRDLRSAILVACLGLPDRFGREPSAARVEAAVARALALDPAVLDTVPLLQPLRGALDGGPVPAPLEDLAVLPDRAELAALVAADSVQGFAVRAVFPVRAAAALCAVLRARSLDAREQRALRPLLDPRSLRQALAAVRGRAGGDVAREWLPLWRTDLWLPDAAPGLRQAKPAARLAWAEALWDRRRDPRAAGLLADLLLDADPAVRSAAGATLFADYGDRVAYDPEWDETRRSAAASRLRALHNRAP